MEKNYSEVYSISDFIEHDVAKQSEMENMLRQSKLEEIINPIYFIFHVHATLMSW